MIHAIFNLSNSNNKTSSTVTMFKMVLEADYNKFFFQLKITHLQTQMQLHCLF